MLRPFRWLCRWMCRRRQQQQQQQWVGARSMFQKCNWISQIGVCRRMRKLLQLQVLSGIIIIIDVIFDYCYCCEASTLCWHRVMLLPTQNAFCLREFCIVLVFRKRECCWNTVLVHFHRRCQPINMNIITKRTEKHNFIFGLSRARLFVHKKSLRMPTMVNGIFSYRSVTGATWTH